AVIARRIYVSPCQWYLGARGAGTKMLSQTPRGRDPAMALCPLRLKFQRRRPSRVPMDKLSSATETALQGIRANQRRLRVAAHEIATAPARGAGAAELAAPLVETIEAQRAIEAAAVVLRR